jgi:hypothetical protein
MKSLILAVALICLSRSSYAEFGAEYRVDLWSGSFGEQGAERMEQRDYAGDLSGAALTDAEREKLAAATADAANTDKAYTEVGHPVKEHLARNWGWYALGTAGGLLANQYQKDAWPFGGGSSGKDEPAPQPMTIDLANVYTANGGDINIDININSGNDDHSSK